MGRLRAEGPLRAAIEVPAAPSDVWQIVANLRRTGEWSKECRRVVPLGNVRQGGWLLGFNRRNRVRWMTVSRIIRFDPGHEIAWRVLTNRSVWTYRLERAADGTRIIETRETPQGISAFARAFTRLLLGGRRVHDKELEAAMLDGLKHIAAALQV